MHLDAYSGGNPQCIWMLIFCNPRCHGIITQVKLAATNKYLLHYSEVVEFDPKFTFLLPRLLPLHMFLRVIFWLSYGCGIGGVVNFYHFNKHFHALLQTIIPISGALHFMSN